MPARSTFGHLRLAQENRHPARTSRRGTAYIPWWCIELRCYYGVAPVPLWPGLCFNYGTGGPYNPCAWRTCTEMAYGSRHPRVHGLARHDALRAAGPLGLGMTLHEEQCQRWRERGALALLRQRRAEHGYGSAVFEEADRRLHPVLIELTSLWYGQWLEAYPHGPGEERLG